MRTLLTLLVGAACLLFASTAAAVPRMSLTAGTPCSACHINVNGGGGRTEIGWGSMAYAGAITYDKLGLDAVDGMMTNTLGEGLVSLGADVRLQVARLGVPQLEDGEAVAPPRRFIPMQIQPYVGVYATDWLTLYGTYAVGPSTFRGNLCDPTYAGQSCFEAQAKIQPSYTAPSIKVGQLRPAIGVRHDDHTMLIVGDASKPRQPTIPPNYSELGGELTYQPVYWLQTDAGVFWARNLSEAIADTEVVGENDPALVGRVLFQPRIDALNMTTWIGTSAYSAGKYHLANGFIGLGLLDRGSLMLEASRSYRGDLSVGEFFGNTDAEDHKTMNLMGILSVQIKEWLIAEGRVERATTNAGGQEFETNAVVAGLQLFPIPYLELRPEYRATWTDQYRMGQYTLQVHAFF